MKTIKYIALGILLSIQSVWAQNPESQFQLDNTTSISEDHSIKNGVYFTREEFISNQPSITENFIKKTSGVWYQKTEDQTVKKLKKKEFFAVVVNGQTYLSQNLKRPVKEVGAYCLYGKTRLAFSVGFVINSGGLSPGITVVEKWYIQNLHTGKIVKANNHNLKKLLKVDDLELFYAFKKDKWNPNGVAKYVKLYNEKYIKKYQM